jgi:hypothetical protein
MVVRTIDTGSGNTGVQVVKRSKHRTQLVKHIGTAKNKDELDSLTKLAYQYIRLNNNTQPLFPELFQTTDATSQKHIVDFDHLVFTKTRHMFAYCQVPDLVDR